MATVFVTNGKKYGIQQVLSILLLVLYLAGTSYPELVHSFVHDHEFLVTHSDEQEKDPCHRLIYHNDMEQGCDHDSHLLVADKCQMCDLTYHGDQTVIPAIALTKALSEPSYFPLYKESLDSYWAVISSSRAPPAVV